MLAMAEINFIKHLREKEDQSVNSIATTLQIDWRTAKKYADRDNWNLDISTRKRRYSVMQDYIEIVDAWLLGDQTVHKKQRHTAKKIFDRLVDEHGFTGSDRTVRDYVSKRKKELKLEEAKISVRLDHPGGEAQVDFGTVRAIVDGQEQELKQLTVSMPCSNAAYPYILPAENAECLLEGLKQIFTRMGGVPRKLWFDNLSAAVISIETEGNRVVTDAFQRFALHYRFESIFCNPGKGNEKGNVENKVGYTRRNWCVPIPSVANLEELQQVLDERAEADMDRPHYSKQESIHNLWDQERTKLLKLPDVPFDVIRLQYVKVNAYGEVKIDSKLEQISRVNPGETVLLKIFWNEVEVINAEHESITRIPRHYMNKRTPIDWKYHLQVFRSKPRSLPYAAVFKWMNANIQTWVLGVSGDHRRSRIYWLLRMLDTYHMDELENVFTSIEHIADVESTELEHKLYKQRNPEVTFTPVNETYTPSGVVGMEPELSKYDALHRQVVSPT